MWLKKSKKYAKSTSDIIIKEMHKDNSVFVPDNSLVSSTLGLEIKVSIDEALERSIRWFRERIKE
jgi:hypothetical protein